MARFHARLLALTETAKKMGLHDKDAADYARAVDGEFKLDGLIAGKEIQALQIAEGERMRLADDTVAEHYCKGEHQIHLRELELQANQIQPSPSSSPAHLPSEASSDLGLLSGLGHFTLEAYHDSVEPID